MSFTGSHRNVIKTKKNTRHTAVCLTAWEVRYVLIVMIIRYSVTNDNARRLMGKNVSLLLSLLPIVWILLRAVCFFSVTERYIRRKMFCRLLKY